MGRNQARYWLACQKVVTAAEAKKAGFLQDIFEDEQYSSRLEDLKRSLILNDRAFIEYVKNRDLQSPKDEINPFSRFWESEEHLKRVDDFLNRK